MSEPKRPGGVQSRRREGSDPRATPAPLRCRKVTSCGVFRRCGPRAGQPRVRPASVRGSGFFRTPPARRTSERPMVPAGSSFRPPRSGSGMRRPSHATRPPYRSIDEAIELPDHERIAVVGGLQRAEKSRPGDCGAGDVLGEDLGAAGVGEGVALQREVLVGGGNAGLADQHGRSGVGAIASKPDAEDLVRTDGQLEAGPSSAIEAAQRRFIILRHHAVQRRRRRKCQRLLHP
jgi:hypothetical protein